MRSLLCSLLLTTCAFPIAAQDMVRINVEKGLTGLELLVACNLASTRVLLANAGKNSHFNAGLCEGIARGSGVALSAYLLESSSNKKPSPAFVTCSNKIQMEAVVGKSLPTLLLALSNLPEGDSAQPPNIKAYVALKKLVEKECGR